MQNIIKCIIESTARYSPLLLSLILVLIDLFNEKKHKKSAPLFILPQRLCLCGVSFYAWLIVSIATQQTHIKAFKGIDQDKCFIFATFFLILHFAFYEWCIHMNNYGNYQIAISYAVGFISLAFPFLIL